MFFKVKRCCFHWWYHICILCWRVKSAKATLILDKSLCVWFNCSGSINNQVCRDGHFRIVYYSRIVKPNPEYWILFCFFSYNALHLRITTTKKQTWELQKQKTLFTQKPRRPTQHTFLDLALEINNLSFHHTNNTFSQHWTTNFLSFMQWCIFASLKWLCQERQDFDNTF